MTDTVDVALRSVTRRFGDVVAVDGVSLNVRKGEFLALLGPSGCGKTTLLNLIAGFLEADEGDIVIRGRSMAGVEPYHRDVGMVFQNYALFPHMTVEENISFGLEMRGVPRAERRGRVEEALALVKLTGFGARYADQLSGGQQQRVALARVLVIRPSVLLLDEPLGALDRQLREEMQVELRQLQQRVGITTIFVTHDQEEALAMSDRIAVVNRGVVEQIGTPGEIYERPRTEFVANFIGVSNTFEGTVTESSGGRTVIETAHGTITASGDAAPGRRVSVVIRPEKMRLSDDLAPPLNALKGQIQEVIYLGTHSRYFVALPGGKLVTVYEQNLSGHRQRPRRPGEEVHVAWYPDETLILAGRAES
jgi:spermidine/putrescine ABC transporter ATP-binding subunit